MALSVARCVEAIVSHSDGLADDAEGHFDAAVSGCPGWRVLDVVEHVIGVQWFWSTIVTERLEVPPVHERRPGRVGPERCGEALRSGARRLADALSAADQSWSVYTWAPTRQDVAFITRHQVQEAAVHHFDVARAIGRSLVIDHDLAADAIEEFLTFSVSSESDPADPPRPALEGPLTLACTDGPEAWVLTDGAVAGTVAVRAGRASGPLLEASASDLLMWLYGRRELAEPPGGVAARLRALTFTG